MVLSASSIDNVALMFVFSVLVAATFVTGAWTFMGQRRRGKGVDAAPRVLPYLTVANSIVAVVGAYRYIEDKMRVYCIKYLYQRKVLTCGLMDETDNRTTWQVVGIRIRITCKYGSYSPAGSSQ
jgi:hypothetical protein